MSRNDCPLSQTKEENDKFLTFIIVYENWKDGFSQSVKKFIGQFRFKNSFVDFIRFVTNPELYISKLLKHSLNNSNENLVGKCKLLIDNGFEIY